MKKERRDLLKKFRYFKILNDCDPVVINGDAIELKKGDIIRIYNSDLTNLIFDKEGGLLWALEMDPLPKDATRIDLQDYPEDKPFDIIEFLNMQEKKQVKAKIECDLSIDTNKIAYLTPEFIEKILNDSNNNVKLMNGDYENVSDYNKRMIKEFKGELDYYYPERTIKMLEESKKNVNDEKECTQKISRENLLQLQDRGIQPGFYKVAGEGFSYIPFAIYFEKGEIIDLSKPEYAMLAFNQSFIKVLARCKEITNLRQKSRIYEKQEKDFLPREYTRYYRLNDNINISSKFLLQYYAKDLRDTKYMEEIGHGFNPYRVKGKIDVVEMDGQRISLIKVTYTNSALFDIVDKELKKISKRLSRKEAVFVHLKETTEAHKKNEEKRNAYATKKGKDYFRTKMFVDLAKSYLEEKPVTEEFKHKAREYFEKNRNLFWKTNKILGYDNNFSEEVFYMMHLIRTEKRDNRIIESEYNQRLQQERQGLVSILNQISKGEDVDERY